MGNLETENIQYFVLLGLPCPSATLRLPFDDPLGERSGRALRGRVVEGFRDLNPTYDAI